MDEGRYYINAIKWNRKL